MRHPQRTNSNSSNRARGRGRKSPNSTSRSFESNGPDVKIRGNASHIAEKYMTLAHDAQSAGDRVVAENYYQHAEHYNRVVAVAAAAAAAAAQEEKRSTDSNIQGNAQSNVQQRKQEAGGDNPSFSGNRSQVESSNRGDVVSDGESAEMPESVAQDEKKIPQPRTSDNRSLRTRRPRNPEPRQSDKAEDDASEVKASKGDQDSENISEDALGLPKSILGSA